jgi:hypothetical protein
MKHKYGEECHGCMLYTKDMGCDLSINSKDCPCIMCLVKVTCEADGGCEDYQTFALNEKSKNWFK